jgi:putative membrane protein
MMGFYGYGWAWLFGLLMMLIFFGGLTVLAIWAVRTFSGPRPGAPESPLDVLKRRLAAGEISAEEYEKTRRALQS